MRRTACGPMTRRRGWSRAVVRPIPWRSRMPRIARRCSAARSRVVVRPIPWCSRTPRIARRRAAGRSRSVTGPLPGYRLAGRAPRRLASRLPVHRRRRTGWRSIGRWRGCRPAGTRLRRRRSRRGCRSRSSRCGGRTRPCCRCWRGMPRVLLIRPGQCSHRPKHH